MSVASDPTMVLAQLGIELRRLREKAGYTALEACEVIGAQGPKMSKIENGRQFPTPDEVRKLSRFYDVSTDEQAYLVGLAEQKPKRRRRTGHRDPVPDWFRRYRALEWDATDIKTYQVESVHGLLQTEDYARSMVLCWEPEADDRLVEQLVANRMERQQVLHRTGRPPVRLELVLSEAVLHRIQGSNRIMHTQLKHLSRMSKRPNVTIRVLPFAQMNRVAVTSAISLLRLAGQNLSTVYLEDVFGATYLKEPEEFTRYAALYGRLRDAALDPESSREMLDGMADRYR
jgi:transcriptional regulator with XRE-family HTH domain